MLRIGIKKSRWQRNLSKSCKKEEYFHSKEEAKKHLMDKTEYVYQCPLCKKWHIVVTSEKFI